MIRLANVLLPRFEPQASLRVTCRWRAGRVSAVVSSVPSDFANISRIILGLRRAPLGTVEVDDLNPAIQSLQVRRRVTFVAQGFPVRPHLSSIANVQLLTALAGRAATAKQARAALRRCDLSDRQLLLPGRGVDLFGKFSIWLAVHRLRATSVLLVDASAGGLDARSHDIRHLLLDAAADGQAVLVLTTDAEFAAGIAQDIFRVQEQSLVHVEKPPAPVWTEIPGDSA